MDITTICGYDTIRLTYPVETIPSDYEWCGFDNPVPQRPSPPSENPCLPDLGSGRLGNAPYGGWYASFKGGRTLWRQQDGVHYEHHSTKWGCYVAAECSLPKLLNGHNKVPVVPSELSRGFDALQWSIRSFLPAAPPVEAMDVWRLDATLDAQLGGELELAQVARVLSDIPLNDVLPVRYPSGGSLRWVKGRGAGRPVYRCYSKSVETGDEAIAGQYRAEAQVSGAKALAFALKMGDLSAQELTRMRTCLCTEPCSHKSWKYLRPETLINEPKVCTGLLGPLLGVLEQSVGLVKGVGGMNSLQAIGLLMSKGGASRSRAVQLAGYAHLVRSLGWEYTGLTAKGQWEARKVFAAAGVDPKTVEFSGVERLAVGGAAGVLFAAGTVIGDKLYDAVVGPDDKKA